MTKFNYLPNDSDPRLSQSPFSCVFGVVCGRAKPSRNPAARPLARSCAAVSEKSTCVQV